MSCFPPTSKNKWSLQLCGETNPPLMDQVPSPSCPLQRAFHKLIPLTPASSDFLSLLNYFHNLTNGNSCRLKTKVFHLISFQIISPYSIFLFSENFLKVSSKFCVSDSSSSIPFWSFSNEVLGPIAELKDFSCQGLSHIAKFNFASLSAVFGHFLILPTFFIWLPGLLIFLLPHSSFSAISSADSSSAPWPVYTRGPRAQARSSFFISLTALLLSFSPRALNAIRVLTTPRSLAGLLTPASYIQRYVSISTCMSQTLYIQKRIPSNCSFHSLPDQLLWSHPWLLFLTHLVSHLTTSPIGSTFETYQEAEYVSRLP